MIFVDDSNQLFHLQTANSSYIIAIAESGHPINLHYGARISHRPTLRNLYQRHQQLGSSTAYSTETGTLSLEALRLEAPCYGKGDYREPLLHIEYADGSRCSDFLFEGYQLNSSKPQLTGLPATHGHDNQSGEQAVNSLTLTLLEPVKQLRLKLHYTLFERSDVITRSLELINDSQQSVTIERVFSSSLDLTDANYELLHLTGKWINECQLTRHPLAKGIFQIDSKKGVSGANHNPFLCLARPTTDELNGECYGFGLIYSGNHHCSVEVSPHGQPRVQLGISDFDFRWPLAAGERFTAPEVVHTYSQRGLNGMSQSFHRLIQHNLIDANWADKPRPIQCNNWEATYFDFDQRKLLKLAATAAKLGVELFVLDDGWFGKRDSDASSLGDFDDHPTKLPKGIAGLSRKVKQLGLQFGIWVEPEMVSTDSQLYQQHPEWAVQLPDRPPSLGRNQLLLDMANPAVVEHLFTQLSGVFSRAKVDYVKWDHNRNLSDIFSTRLSRAQQGGFAHRYVLGLYQLLQQLKQAFPEILFESCSSGGNRFDMGMLYFMPQTWTSDNTDAVERMRIQYGSSMLYPPSCMSCHVSGRPSHQVLRNTPIETRFNVAAFGNLGYQLDLTQLTQFEQKAVNQQIAWYKRHRQLLQFGRFYRLQSPFDNNRMLWVVVSEDRQQALLGYYQILQQSSPDLEQIRLPQLNPDACYQVVNRPQFQNIRQFGNLINKHLPIDLKDRGLIHSLLVNHYMQLVNEERWQLYGDELAAFGLPLKSQFMGTEMTDAIRHIGDFGSRIYHFALTAETAAHS